MDIWKTVTNHVYGVGNEILALFASHCHYFFRSRAFLLVDSRHGIKASDVEMMGTLEDFAIPFQVRENDPTPSILFCGL